MLAKIPLHSKAPTCRYRNVTIRGYETTQNRRNRLRVSCNVPVTCVWDEHSHEGQLKDVSPHGLRLELDPTRRFKRGQELWIERPSVELNAVRAVVRWCRRHSHRDAILLGLEVQSQASELEQSWLHPIFSTFEFLHPHVFGNGKVEAPAPPQPEPAPEPQAEPVPKPLAEAEVPQVQWDEFLAQAQAQLLQPSQPLMSKLWRGFREFAFEDRPSVEERRRCERLSCNHTAKISGFPVTVLDLSAAGLGCLAGQKFSRGSLVEIVTDDSKVQGRVRYCRLFHGRFRVGLEFATSLANSWVSSKLKTLGYSSHHLEQKRRYVRVQTSLPIEVRNWQGDFEKGLLLDLSVGGCLVATPRQWQEGETLRLIVGPVGYLPVMFLTGTVLDQRLGEEGWKTHVQFSESGGDRLEQYIKAFLTRPR